MRFPPAYYSGDRDRITSGSYFWEIVSGKIKQEVICLMCSLVKTQHQFQEWIGIPQGVLKKNSAQMIPPLL